jgi:hypothetical protein
MNKTKIALTIAELVGSSLLLSIILLTTILIEGLQTIIALIKFLNSDKIVEFTCALLIMPSIPIKEIKLTNFKPKWMLELLSKEYLNI